MSLNITIFKKNKEKIADPYTIISEMDAVNANNVYKISIEKDELEKVLGNTFDGSYIWVGLNEEGFVVVVGKTKANIPKKDYGDLFKKYAILGATPKYILEIITKNEEKEKEVLKSIDSKINNYIKKAIIVPFEENEFSSTPHELEKLIGNTLLENEIPILNKFSHNYGR